MSASVRKSLTDFFNRIDSDKNGKLDFKEFALLFSKMGFRGKSAMAASVCFYSIFGLPQDSYITLDHFLSIYGDMPNTRTATVNDTTITKLFEAIDTDHSGNISVPEIRGLFGKLGQRVSTSKCENYLRDFDRDHNGTLEIQEFKSLMTRVFNEFSIE